jgi:hypothetical protein
VGGGGGVSAEHESRNYTHELALYKSVAVHHFVARLLCTAARLPGCQVLPWHVQTNSFTTGGVAVSSSNIILQVAAS